LKKGFAKTTIKTKQQKVESSNPSFSFCPTKSQSHKKRKEDDHEEIER
jgi:hypothetical protein